MIIFLRVSIFIDYRVNCFAVIVKPTVGLLVSAGCALCTIALRLLKVCALIKLGFIPVVSVAALVTTLGDTLGAVAGAVGALGTMLRGAAKGFMLSATSSGVFLLFRQVK
jgi:hypothetical protein